MNNTKTSAFSGNTLDPWHSLPIHALQAAARYGEHGDDICGVLRTLGFFDAYDQALPQAVKGNKLRLEPQLTARNVADRSDYTDLVNDIACPTQVLFANLLDAVRRNAGNPGALEKALQHLVKHLQKFQLRVLVTSYRHFDKEVQQLVSRRAFDEMGVNVLFH